MGYRNIRHHEVFPRLRVGSQRANLLGRGRANWEGHRQNGKQGRQILPDRVIGAALYPNFSTGAGKAIHRGHPPAGTRARDWKPERASPAPPQKKNRGSCPPFSIKAPECFATPVSLCSHLMRAHPPGARRGPGKRPRFSEAISSLLRMQKGTCMERRVSTQKSPHTRDCPPEKGNGRPLPQCYRRLEIDFGNSAESFAVTCFQFLEFQLFYRVTTAALKHWRSGQCPRSSTGERLHKSACRNCTSGSGPYPGGLHPCVDSEFPAEY